MLQFFRFMDAIFVLIACANSLLNADSMGVSIATREVAFTKFPDSTKSAIEVSFLTRFGANATEWSNASHIGYCEGEDAFQSPTDVVFRCPHQMDVTYIVIMSLWGAYTLLVLGVRTVAVWRYSTDDFRYYFALDQLNGSKIQSILYVVGVAFSIATFAVTIFYISDDDPLNAGRVWASIMFVVTNIIVLNFSCVFCRSGGMDSAILDDFPELKVKEMPGGNGVLNVLPMVMSPTAFFTTIQYELAQKLAKNKSGTVCEEWNKLCETAEQGEALARLMLRLQQEQDVASDTTKNGSKEESAPVPEVKQIRIFSTASA